MPARRTPLDKPYKGHHPRAGTINPVLKTPAPPYVPAPPQAWVIVLEYRTEHERDQAQRELDWLWDNNRKECVCLD